MTQAPTTEQIEKSNLFNFMNFVAKDGHDIQHYQDLYDFSVRLPQLFWKYLWDYGSFIQHSEHTSVLKQNGNILESTWFEGARFNFAENLLKYRDDRPAITAYDKFHIPSFIKKSWS